MTSLMVTLGLDHLHEFTSYVKYPRTFHLPWSPGCFDDDRMLSYDPFNGRRVVVHEKLDGENTSVYRSYVHARSINSDPHVSRTWTKNFVAGFQHDIPDRWRLCGENVYAKHSIKYLQLATYFFGFSVWNERNVCLPYNETRDWFKLLGVTECPVLFEGMYDEKVIKALYNEKTDWDKREGYVIRVADAFTYGEYKNSVAKYVGAAMFNHPNIGRTVKLEPNELLTPTTL